MDRYDKYTEAKAKKEKVIVPRIKETKAVLECKVIKFLEYDGDHIILVGEVIHAETEKG